MKPRINLPIRHERPAPLRVLLIDSPRSNEIVPLLEASHDIGFHVTRVHGVEAGLQRLRDDSFDAVLLDLSLEDSQGSDTLAPARVAANTVPFVVFDTEQDEDLALRAHRFGAQDYLVKSECDTRLLVRTVRHAMERSRILNDLARARQYEHFLATHDVLTGLPNRLALMDHVRRALSAAGRAGDQVALLFLDLDRFKNINDSMGHGVGDDLLGLVARRLAGLVRSSDILARIGGDEFVVLLQRVRRDHDPGRVAAKITTAMTSPFVLGHRDYHITTSVGIAVSPQDGDDSETLMRNADTAMYHAKQGGANRYAYFSRSLNRSVKKRFDIENGLLDALAHNSLRLHFQPLVDVALGVTTGAEALVRWQHAERGLIPPSEFIPYAEEAGLMILLGGWVLRAACEYAVAWPEVNGRRMQVCVNVSSRQLCDDGFPDEVMRTIRETGLAPSRLTIEITEHSVLQEAGVTLGAVRFLRDLGARVVVDDFGTGYSAINALKTLPIDGIKIDRSFVADMVESSVDTTIIRGLISIARGLGLTITAEGVETRDQLELLHGLGVNHMQGYLFGKPIASDDFSQQLASDPEVWTREIPEL